MAEREGFEPSKGKIPTLINPLKQYIMSLVSLFLVFLRAKMDDFDDELRLTFEQTEMLRRICEAISYSAARMSGTTIDTTRCSCSRALLNG